MIWTSPINEAQLQTPLDFQDIVTPKEGWYRMPGPAERRWSPVYKLNVDLLYRIFESNSEMTADRWRGGSEEHWNSRALITTRRTSQVCRLWREIILSSSSIWARALDLQLLDQESNFWREEVLRRSGNAFIHLRGTVLGHHRQSREFFERVIVENWARIRVLDVEIYHPRTFKPDIWNVLTRPAPVLRSLTLRFRPCTLSPLSLPHGPIFDNIAPSLCEFLVEQLTFDPHSLWLSRLRRFGVYATKNTPFNASQILEILSHMPLLESLTIGNAFPEETPDANTIQPIQLPMLSEIVIPEMELNVCLAIIGRIVPRRDCVLDMFCKQRLNRSVANAPTSADKFAKTVLTTYITAFFNSHVVSFFSLHHSHRVLTLQDRPSGNQSRFRISIDHYDPSFLFDIYSSCQYPGVKTLELRLDQRAHDADGDTTKPLPSITTFLRQFKDVDSIYVDRSMIHHINNTRDEAAPFPSLRHISTIGSDFLRESKECLHNTLGCFVGRCAGGGVSIQTLDLSGCKFMVKDLKSFGEGFSKQFGVEVRV